MKTLRTLALLSFAGLAGPVLASTECMITALPDGKVVRQNDNQTIPLPARMSPCEGLKVDAGRVLVCTQDRRSRLQCRNLSKGSQIAADSRPDSSSASAAGNPWGDGFLALLEGSVGSSAAVSRGDSSNDLPAGSVLALDNRVAFDFTSPDLKYTSSIEILEGTIHGPLMAVMPASAGRAVLDVRSLRRGKNYWWKLVGISPQTPARYGQFTLEDPAAVRQATAERQRSFRDHHQAPSASHLAFAHWLWTQQYDFDARQALREQGLLKTIAKTESTGP